MAPKKPADLFDNRRAHIRQLKERVKDFPYHKSVSELHGPTVTLNGKEYIFFSSNDRLGMSADKRVREAAADAARRFGCGLNSHFLGGRMKIHDELESKLASLVGAEKALVFNSGYLANIGIIPSLAQDDDALFVDKDAHACIIDGYNLSRAEKKRFLHNNIADLNDKLAQCDKAKNKLVVVEGVYSLQGDVCQLDQVMKAARNNNACVMIDDAHGLGVLGKGGSGTASSFGFRGDRDLLVMGTFNKSLGSIGGFVAGDREFIEYLQFTTRSYIFTAAISPPLTAAVTTSLNIIEKEPEHIDRVWANAKYIHQELGRLGYSLNPLKTPIIPIWFSNETDAHATCQLLFEEGVFAHAFSPPAVPEGKSAIRLVALASHTQAQLDKALKAFEKVRNKIANQKRIAS